MFKRLLDKNNIKKITALSTKKYRVNLSSISENEWSEIRDSAQICKQLKVKFSTSEYLLEALTASPSNGNSSVPSEVLPAEPSTDWTKRHIINELERKDIGALFLAYLRETRIQRNQLILGCEFSPQALKAIEWMGLQISKDAAECRKRKDELQPAIRAKRGRPGKEKTAKGDREYFDLAWANPNLTARELIDLNTNRVEGPPALLQRRVNALKWLANETRNGLKSVTHSR